MNTLTQTNIKKDFPVFLKHPDLVYLDTGASALTPQPVVDAITRYYTDFPVNIHRGMYDLSQQATEHYDAARRTVAQFLNASFEETIFTSGTTHGLNLAAHLLENTVQKGDVIVLTRMEHHANLIPWQRLAKKRGAVLRFIELKDYAVDMDSARGVIDERTKIVAVTMMSNVLGTKVPVREIAALARHVGAVVVVDAAQGVVHEPVDVQALDCDILALSGHKLYGPCGIGVLYAKKALLEAAEPFFTGGDMIRHVTYEDASWADLPNKFEAGTQHISGAIGLAAAIDYIRGIGWDFIQTHEAELTKYAIDQLRELVTLVGTCDTHTQGGVVSFLIDGTHPHDVGDILAGQGIAVRVGHHCAMPLMRYLNITGTVRASFGVYSTKEDVDALIRGIRHVKEVLHV